ncbi:hypothetical protein BGW39_011834 [Mortierella sp. 14UC]|nr:hypothetical protein BGW39_011834 [Mortierella sp. 14UC]
MAKGDIMTPPGTGYIDSLTPEQTAALKEVWSIIFHIADTGEAIVPAHMIRDVEKEALSGKNPQATTVQDATKAGWFSGNKSAQAEEAARAEGHGTGMAKISLEDLGLSVDKLRPILWDNVMGDHPDALLLRFIRARKWNTINALSMMFKAFKWRLDEDIPAVKYSSDIQLNHQNPNFFDQLEMGKFYIKGTDIDGRIVAYLNVKLHHPGDQPPKTLEKLTIYVMECGRVMVEHPVETVCLVFDLTGFSLSNMDFAMVRYLISIFEAYYPESLGRIVVHGAPFVFWGVWKIIEPWMDPVVASKIRFTKKDQDLLEYIPAEHLPSRYNCGKDKYVYKYIHAREGENDHMADTATKDRLVGEWKALMWKFEALTREWVQLGKDKQQVDAGRTEEVVVKERGQLAKELRVAYFRMDPYIRARNLFHRQGVALPDGGVNWVYDN